MFWALISPFRHSADPPRLSSSSPLRYFFQRHGETVARHPIVSIVVSVVLAVVLCYPFPILYSTTAPGLPSVPHHVWTSARPFSGAYTVPDIGIKQVWVQGSYMDAVNPEVLEEALRIQGALLGPGTSCDSFSEGDHFDQMAKTEVSRLDGDRNKTLGMPAGMFFHSPLLYWNCSLSAVQNDMDLLQTVNSGINRRSAANVTLRWGSVFAGKRFRHQQLIGADALVISLFYQLDSRVGELWDQRATYLAKSAETHKRYEVYPSDGREKGSTLYEFRFQPMSRLDNIMLASCYFFMLVYLALSLRRLQAVKSKLGLIATVLTQIGFSIMSSFTILALLKVPVSHVPREVFPFVVIVIGLENMFRLINAVLATPAEQPTTIRIATALGEVGFLSTVAVATDLALLFIIGHFSVPAVREFCTFAGVALVMDFVLHLTYFLAVLSVDVRRLELQDSLDRMDLSESDCPPPQDITPEKPGSLADFLMRGAIPFSTRIAGSAIMICFLVALNMHFLENQSPLRTFLSLFEMVASGLTSGNSENVRGTAPNMPINVARSPTSWLKLQDQLTGKELIRIVKPGAYRMVAKAFNPTFFVLRGSNRSKIPSMLPNLANFIDLNTIADHFQGFILTIVVVVAGLTMLMNHFLVKCTSEDIGDVAENNGPLLTFQTLYEGHSLDVVMLATSLRGVVVSVGLDRRIVVWRLKNRWQASSKDIIRPTCSEHILWPVMAIALDEKGEWLAIAPRVGRISFWHVGEAVFKGSVAVDLAGHQPSSFFFEPGRRGDPDQGPCLIVLRQNGWLSEICIRTRQAVHHRICTGVVVSSSHGVCTPRLPLRIVTACQKGRIFVTSKSAGDWHTGQLNMFDQPMVPPMLEAGGEASMVLLLSALGMIVVSRSCSVDLVDLLSGSVVRTFQTGQFKPSTLRAFHANRRTCLYCGCPAVLSFSIAYSEKESGMFIMHTFFSSRGRMRDICLRAERDRRERKCTGFESVVEAVHWLENVEGWEPTNLNMVAGIRRRETTSEDQSSSDHETSYSLQQTHSLRRRRQMQKKQSADDEDEDEWEAWTMHADGAVMGYPLSYKNGGDNDNSLLVSRVGPVSKVGQRSVAVGFGNTVKVLLVGNERYEDDEDEDLYRISRRARSYHRR